MADYVYIMNSNSITKNIDPFTLIILQNKTDFIIAKNPFCKKCLCNKLSTNILRTFNLTKQETKEILKYGVRAELVNLCLIPNVGKARAERLWKAGIKNSSDFISTDVGKLAKVMKVSPKIAEETFREALLI